MFVCMCIVRANNKSTQYRGLVGASAQVYYHRPWLQCQCVYVFYINSNVRILRVII